MNGKRIATLLTLLILILTPSLGLSANYEYYYTVEFNSLGEITVKDGTGRILDGVIDGKPITRINAVKNLTIIEAEGSHFIIINGKKYYLPH